MTVNGKKVLSLTLAPDGIGKIKSPGLWAHVDAKRSTIVPLIYFIRPKWIPQDEFKRLIERILIKDNGPD